MAIFSKEMLAVDLLKKQIARICEIPVSEIFKQNYDKEEVRKKMESTEAWRNNRVQIINPSTFKGVADIAKIQMTHKFDVWFLDFIQLLEFSKVANTSSDFNIQVGQNMRNLQSLALGTKSVGIILSQVRKGIEHRANKKPTVSDIEWSGLIKQLSSYIFFSYYPCKYYGNNLMPDDYYYLIGEKTRFAENFIFPMKIEASLGKFSELSASDKSQLMKKFNTIVG
ncbi:MAG TPA: DnaB-like helicase C-terminal domain-containing protein [Methanosarcinales archaeon]|nr:DnaB-like helicase C-terminal domain-containing protein [Methanosarcinales archaeon]